MALKQTKNCFFAFEHLNIIRCSLPRSWYVWYPLFGQIRAFTVDHDTKRRPRKISAPFVDMPTWPAEQISINKDDNLLSNFASPYEINEFERHGQAWTLDEDVELIRARSFKQCASLNELSKTFKRSPGALKMREKLLFFHPFDDPKLLEIIKEKGKVPIKQSVSSLANRFGVSESALLARVELLSQSPELSPLYAGDALPLDLDSQRDPLYCYFAITTDDVHPNSAQILEIASRVDSNWVTAKFGDEQRLTFKTTFHAFVKPPKEVNLSSVAFHGLDMSKLTRKKSLDAVLVEFIEWLEELKAEFGVDKVILVGHNAHAFSAPILKLHAKNDCNNIIPPWLSFADSLIAFNRSFGVPYGYLALQSLVQKLVDPSFQTRYRAQEQTDALAKLCAVFEPKSAMYAALLRSIESDTL